MMTKKAKVYGSSLYDLAKEEGLTGKILEDLKLINSAVSGIPGYSKLLESPAVSKQEKRELLKEAWENTVHRYSLNFMMLLCDNSMAGELSDCAKEYKRRYDEDHNILQVTVTSAVPLTAQQREKLAAAVRQRTGKTAEFTEKTDPALIGGMRLEADGTAFDGSVSYHMDTLRRLLQEGTN